MDEVKPILLPDLSGADFHRSDVARAAGYTCTIALPCFAAERMVRHAGAVLQR